MQSPPSRTDSGIVAPLGAPDAGVWEIDFSTGKHTWSRGLYVLLGYAPGEVPPSREHFEARVHPSDRPRLQRYDAEMPSRAEYRVVLPDGETRWLSSFNYLELGPDGSPTRALGVVLDVPESRAAQAHLRNLAELARRTSNALVVTDAKGRIEWVNEAFARITGFSLDEAVGRSPGALLQGPDTSPDAIAQMREGIAQGRGFELVVLNYARSGRQYWVHLETRPLLGPDGVLTGFISIQTDVTEARIAASRESLSQRIAAALLASDSLDAGAQALVRLLVGELDIRVAQLWTVDAPREVLTYRVGASSHPRGEAWLALTRALPFAKGTEWVVGVGAPGVAWGTGATFVRTDFWSDDATGAPSRRNAAARAAGIRTVCSVPVLGPEGVLAVIEVGGSHSYPGYDRLPSLLERVAEQFAAFVLHDRSRRAFEAVFQQSPDALLIVDPGGAITALNAVARRTFGDIDRASIEDHIEGGAALTAQTLNASGTDDATLDRHTCRARTVTGQSFSAEITLAQTPIAGARAAIFAVRNITDRLRIEAELRDSLRQKAALLQEVHHRVKNLLQIVTSMLSIESSGVEDPTQRDAMLDMTRRVRSMALVHEQLYAHDDVARIDLGAYASTLCVALVSSIAPGTRFEFELAAVEVGVERAIPCGLILNELISNALFQSRAARSAQAIFVGVRSAGDGFELEVTAAADPAQKDSRGTLGQALIRGLLRQLRARMTTRHDRGETVVVSVPRERFSSSSALAAVRTPTDASTAPKGAALPPDEEARVAALEATNILDTAPEEMFDDIARLASHLCGTPIALVSFVDRGRQWFKSAVGLTVSETSRDVAFCAHAILQPWHTMEVPDAHADPRFRDNALVTGDPHVRFYAGAPIVSESGHALGTVCVIDHVPRALNEAQERSLRALSRAVTRLLRLRANNTSLQRALSMVESTRQSHREFLGVMSHEIRTPLNAILGLTDLALEHAVGDQLALLQRLHTNASALDGIFRDILEYARLEVGQVESLARPCSLRALCDSVVQELAAPAATRGLELSLHVEDAVPEVLLVNDRHTRQVLANLVRNAITFTDEGSVSLTVSLVDDSIEVVTVRMVVRDTGRGIPKALLGRVFDQFFQVDGTSRRAAGGTGLGLSISRKLATLMGGALTLQSEVGRGTVATFELPLHRTLEAIPQLVPSDANPPRSPAAPRTLLVIDDNPDILEYARRVLVRAGFVVQTASRGAEALTWLEHHTADAVLADIDMPEMDGFTLARILRQREQAQGLARLPIVAVSAHAMPGFRERCLEVGMDDYLPKPFKRAELVALAERWCAPRSGSSAASAAVAPEEPGIPTREELDPDVVDLVPGYLDARQAELPVLRSALAAAEMDRVASIAHNLKGAGTSYGFTEISRLGQAIETDARSGAAVGIPATIDALERYIARARLALCADR